MEPNEAGHQAQRLRETYRSSRKIIRNPSDMAVTGAEFEARRRSYVGLKTDTGSPVLSVDGSGRYRIDLTGGCPTPFERRVRTRQKRTRGATRVSGYSRAVEPGGSVMIIQHRCNRKDCKTCADRLFRRWCARAAAEFRKAERTWMCTLTLSLEQQLALAMAVRLEHGLELSDRRYRTLRAAELGRMVYRWLRGATGWDVAANLRYFAVIEPHDSEKTSVSTRGNPHVHLLLHEKHIGSVVSPILVVPVRKGYQGPPVPLLPRTESGEWKQVVDRKGEPRLEYRLRDEVPLRQQWHFGHSRVTLCLDESAAVEVAKYIRKQPLGRVKASHHYGEDAVVAASSVE